MVLKKSEVARPISPPKINKEMSKLMSASQKSADPELVACDIFKPSGSNLTLIKSTSFEEKMSKQKHNWEVISCSPDAETKKNKLGFYEFA